VPGRTHIDILLMLAEEYQATSPLDGAAVTRRVAGHGLSGNLTVK